MRKGGRKSKTVLLPDRPRDRGSSGELSSEVFSKPEIISVTKPIIPKRTQLSKLLVATLFSTG